MEKLEGKMSEEVQNAEKKEVDLGSTTKKDSVSLKVLVIGIPIFIVQLIAVYFITANILMDKVQGSTIEEVDPASVEETSAEESEDVTDSTEKSDVVVGKYIYSVDDIIVNPAGTNGQQLLLTSIAFDLGSEEDKANLEGKDVVVKDMIISVLSSKTISLLSNTAYKDSLKNEISEKLAEFVPDAHVNRVYFSKYIIN